MTLRELGTRPGATGRAPAVLPGSSAGEPPEVYRRRRGHAIRSSSIERPELAVDDDELARQVLPVDGQVPDREPRVIPAEAMGDADRHEPVRGLEHADA